MKMLVHSTNKAVDVSESSLSELYEPPPNYGISSRRTSNVVEAIAAVKIPAATEDPLLGEGEVKKI
jgi:hypothetical protein